MHAPQFQFEIEIYEAFRRFNPGHSNLLFTIFRAKDQVEILTLACAKSPGRQASVITWHHSRLMINFRPEVEAKYRCEQLILVRSYQNRTASNVPCSIVIGKVLQTSKFRSAEFGFTRYAAGSVYETKNEKLSQDTK